MPAAVLMNKVNITRKCQANGRPGPLTAKGSGAPAASRSLFFPEGYRLGYGVCPVMV